MKKKTVFTSTVKGGLLNVAIAADSASDAAELLGIGEEFIGKGKKWYPTKDKNIVRQALEEEGEMIILRIFGHI